MPSQYNIIVRTTGVEPPVADKPMVINVIDVGEFVPVTTEYTTPGAVTVPKPVGATRLTIECIGAGGPGCIGSALGELTSYRIAHTYSSLMRSGLPIIPADSLRSVPVAFDVWEPGIYQIDAPPECIGQPAKYEAIGGGAAGYYGGAGGGQYATSTKVVTETRHNLNVPPAMPLGPFDTNPRPATIFDSTNTITHCKAAGGQAGNVGSWGGGTGANTGVGDLMYTGGRGSGTGSAQGCGGSAAWSGGPGINATETVPGASPGAPAGAGGFISQPGNAEGGGGGGAAVGSEGWIAITWTYPSSTPTAGGGGGGGAFAERTDYNVAALAGVYVSVPGPPLTNTRVNGASAVVRANDAAGAILCEAAGGNHGVSQDVGDGLGGQVVNCIGDVAYPGGNGSSAVTTGGAGGSAAGPDGPGYTAQGDTGGLSPGAPAGAGGNNGQAGLAYGGGGGSSDSVGTGAGGWIRLTWT